MSRSIIGKEETKLLVTIVAVIFVAAALFTLPYQNQIANAAPSSKKYQVYVTLTGVPANAPDVEVNASIMRMPFFVTVSNYGIETVTSPSNGDTVKFVFTVPAGSNENSVFVCSTQVNNPDLNDCDVHSLPSKVSGPIRLEDTYPLCHGSCP